MALGACRRCGRTTAWEHPACPHCGVEDPLDRTPAGAGGHTARSRGREALRRGGTLVVVVIVVVSLLALCTSPGWNEFMRPLGDLLP